jgi:hypothetical protein
VDHVRQDFRLIVDVHHGQIVSRQVDIVQLAPQGDLYYRDGAGGLRPLAGEDLHSSDSYVMSRLHPHLADAKHEAAAELERRGEHLLALALQCRQFKEGTDG